MTIQEQHSFGSCSSERLKESGSTAGGAEDNVSSATMRPWILLPAPPQSGMMTRYQPGQGNSAGSSFGDGAATNLPFSFFFPQELRYLSLQEILDVALAIVDEDFECGQEESNRYFQGTPPRQPLHGGEEIQ